MSTDASPFQELKSLGHIVAEAAGYAPSGEAILRECLEVASFLIDKNCAYGNSALDPVRIFSTAGPEEQLRVRIDDKLSRLSHWPGEGYAAIPEDVVLDLIGYLILLRIATQDTNSAGDVAPAPMTAEQQDAIARTIRR